MGIILTSFSQFFSSYFQGMKDMFSSVGTIVAICFAILGVAITFLSRRIARIIRKRNEIEDNDTVLVSFKVVGLVCMLIAFLILVLQIVIN